VVSQTEWRGQRDTTRGRLYRLLALSALLHAPFTPIVALLGLVGLLLKKPAEEPPAADPVAAIPIDLVPDERPATPPPTPTEPEEPAPEKSSDDPFKDLQKDDDGEPREPSRKDAGTPSRDAGPVDAGPAIGDPVAMAGVAGKVVDANANVRILIFADRVRNHPLGTRLGTLLSAAPQWSDFFGPTGLDPIKDVDRILIAGPQLRSSAEVVAVLRVNVSHDRLHKAIDALVQRDDQGGWLDAGVPAARLHADRAERLMVLPAQQILVVAPPSAEKHALSLGSNLKFPNPKGNEALTTFVITPWRAFVGIPFEIPKSIKWVRMKVVTTSDGGATAELVAEDESAESATAHAEELTKSVNKVTQLSLPSLSIGGLSLGGSVSLLEPVTFKPVGKEIHATVVATPKQLARLLEAVSAYAQELAAAAEKKRAAKAADAGAKDAASSDASAPDASLPAADAAKAKEPEAPPSKPKDAGAD